MITWTRSRDLRREIKCSYAEVRAIIFAGTHCQKQAIWLQTNLNKAGNLRSSLQQKGEGN